MDKVSNYIKQDFSVSLEDLETGLSLVRSGAEVYVKPRRRL